MAILTANPAQRAHAADFSVHDTGDPLANGVALVGAINNAMSTPEEDDRVLLDPGVHYTLTSPAGTDPDTGLPVITSGVTIRGGYDTAGNLTTIERLAKAPPFRILLIQPKITWVPQKGCEGPEPVETKPTVRLEYLRISNGDTLDTAHFGGGISNQAGHLFVYRSEISGNRAFNGGGIDNVVYDLSYINHCFGLEVNGHNYSGDVSIQESTLRNNRAIASGGGLRNSTTMRIDRSTISANQGDEHGGGLVNTDTLEITDSTISGNFTAAPDAPRPGDAAAGVENSGGQLTVSFSTIAFNAGTGVTNVESRGSVTLSDTILAGNVAFYTDSGSNPQPFDCFGPLRSLGHNLIGAVDPRSGCTVTPAQADQIGSDRAAPIDARLSTTLGSNGGYTQTHALLVGSPAINRAHSAASECPFYDQRGEIRHRIPADSCDIGAFEWHVPGNNCPIDCNVWRAVSVCVNNPLACHRIVIPQIDKLGDFPAIPKCLLDGPGCGPLGVVGFQ